MKEVYKINSDKYDPKVEHCIRRWSDHLLRTGTRAAILGVRKHSFNVRVVQLWNHLPREIVSAASLNSFKNKLDKIWTNQDIIYEYTASIIYHYLDRIQRLDSFKTRVANIKPRTRYAESGRKYTKPTQLLSSK